LYFHLWQYPASYISYRQKTKNFIIIPHTKGDKMQIGEAIKQIRMNRNLSESEVAKHSGIPLSTIHSIECGNNKEPSFQNIAAICAVLDFSLDKLKYINDNEEINNIEYNNDIIENVSYINNWIDNLDTKQVNKYIIKIIMLIVIYLSVIYLVKGDKRG